MPRRPSLPTPRLAVFSLPRHGDFRELERKRTPRLAGRRADQAPSGGSPILRDGAEIGEPALARGGGGGRDARLAATSPFGFFLTTREKRNYFWWEKCLNARVN